MDLPYFGSHGDLLILISLVKKASKNNSVKRGVKEVVKSLRKKVIGQVKSSYSIFIYRVVFIAGDISPIDVVTHLTVLCEDHNIPYVFVPSKEDLGSAGSTKRPTSVIMVPFKKDVDYADTYKEVYDEVKELNAK